MFGAGGLVWWCRRQINKDALYGYQPQPLTLLSAGLRRSVQTGLPAGLRGIGFSVRSLRVASIEMLEKMLSSPPPRFSSVGCQVVMLTRRLMRDTPVNSFIRDSKRGPRRGLRLSDQRR